MKNKQTILITGATGNIGGGAAVALAKRGAKVVLLGRRLETLKTRADSIRTALSEALIEYQDKDIDTMVVDFSDMESVRRAASEVEKPVSGDSWPGTICSCFHPKWSEHLTQWS